MYVDTDIVRLQTDIIVCIYLCCYFGMDSATLYIPLVLRQLWLFVFKMLYCIVQLRVKGSSLVQKAM